MATNGIATTMTDPSQCHWDMIHLTTSGKLDGETLKRCYSDWSTEYNQDFAKAGYHGPRIGAERLSRLVPNKDVRILDVGCGTGLVGEELAKLGFSNIHGADICEKLLDVARGTGCYRTLNVCDVSNDGIPCKEEKYDVLICVGTFTPGHLNQSVFPEFCRVVKQGGFIIIAMREEYIYTAPEFRGGQLDAAAVKLCEEKVWRYVTRQRVEGYIDAMAGVEFVFQVQ